MQSGAQGAVARSITGADVPGQPRQPPRFSAQPRHLPAFQLDGHGVSLQPALDSVLLAFRAGIVGSRPLGAAGHLPAVSQNPTDAVHIYPYALTGAGGVYVPSGHLDLSGSFYMDGSSLLLVGSTTFDGLTLSLASVTSAGMAGVYVTASFAAGDHLLSTAIQLQITPNTTRVGTTFLDADLLANTFWATGVMVGLTAMRQVTDLGFYRGDDLERLARVHEIDVEHEGLRRTELVHLRGQSLAVRGGGGSFKIAALGRLELAKSHQTTMRLLGNADMARTLLFEGSGLGQWARNKGRALQICRENASVPTMQTPADIAIGNEVLEQHSQSASPSVIVGNLAVFFGVQAFVRRDFELGVHRLDDAHVEVTLNPTRIRNGGVFVASPFGPEVDVGCDVARSLRQCWTFDLREPAAKAALLTLQQQRLPPSLVIPWMQPRSWRAPLGHQAAFQASANHLPEGVARRWSHAINSREWRYGLGVDWRLVPYWLTPNGWVMAFGVHQSHIRERQLVTTETTVHLADSRTRQRAFDRLFAGRFCTTATAQLRTASQDASPMVFDGLSVRSEWMLVGAGHNAVQARILKPMRTRFGLPLPDAKPARGRQERTVSLEQDLAPDQLGLPAGHPSRFVQWHRAAQQSGVGPRAAMQLLHQVDAAQHQAALSEKAPADATWAQARIVQRFIARHGQRGCAFVFRNAGGPRPLRLSSRNSTTEAALSGADRLALKYPDPLAATTSPTAALARLHAAIDAQQAVMAAITDAAGDAFLRPDDKALLDERLAHAQWQLGQLAAMSEATQAALGASVLRQAAQAGRKPWRRGRARRAKALAGLFVALPALRREVQQLEAQYGQRPMPQALGPLAARAQAIWATETKLHTYHAWLQTADAPLEPAVRQAHLAQTQALLARLGASAASDGLWAPQSLSPSARAGLAQHIGHSSLSARLPAVLRRLRRDLDHPRRPCPL